MRPRRSLRLRTVLSLLTVAITGLAVTVVVALVALASYLHRTTDTLAMALESVHLVEEAEVDLLAHARARDDQARLEDDLRRRLDDLHPFATTREEKQVLRRAEDAVDAYLRAPGGDPGALDNAVSSLERLVDVNVSQARAAREHILYWNARAEVLGLSVGAILLVTAALLLWWLRARAFRPLLELGETMESFGRGDRQVRSRESGPRELRDMALRFNEMAGSIMAQREAQMTFLAGVAHDLRTPLSALRLAVGRFRPDAPLPPESQVRHTLEVVERQVTRMERMLGDLLDVAKIEAGQLELRVEERDLRELLREVHELFRASPSGHRLELKVPGQPVIAPCDPLRLGQVVANLVSNAIKYSPAGAIELGLARDAAEATIWVKDHGIGIAEDDQRRLFEPFRRVGPSRENIPGVGLGLFVVQRIVQAHHGRIDVESAPGKGSTFRVHLPLAP